VPAPFAVLWSWAFWVKMSPSLGFRQLHRTRCDRGPRVTALRGAEQGERRGGHGPGEKHLHHTDLPTPDVG